MAPNLGLRTTRHLAQRWQCALESWRTFSERSSDCRIEEDGGRACFRPVVLGQVIEAFPRMRPHQGRRGRLEMRLDAFDVLIGLRLSIVRRGADMLILHFGNI